MGAETETLIDTLAELFNMTKISCNGCSQTFYATAKYDTVTEATEIKGKCPKCGSKDLTLAQA